MSGYCNSQPAVSNFHFFLQYNVFPSPYVTYDCVYTSKEIQSNRPLIFADNFTGKTALSHDSGYGKWLYRDYTEDTGQIHSNNEKMTGAVSLGWTSDPSIVVLQ